MEKIILHLDMDAFFASVEQNDNPELKGKPIVVGGIGQRGVVSTCSYEAREYGIHSAMPVFMAKQKCPHAIFLPVRMKRYKRVSEQIFKILSEYTEKIEPLSIDEAFLDITEYKNNYESIAYKIKGSIKRKTGLTVSAGVSYNKFLAKLASDWNKPDGFKIITPDMVPDILLPLDVNKIYGIGKKSTQKLNAIGIYTVADLMKLSENYLTSYFGKYGAEIYNLIRGIDNREVITQTEAKSYGRENTLATNTRDKAILIEELRSFSIHISFALRVKGHFAHTVTIKIKTATFLTHTKSQTLNVPVNMSKDIFNIAVELLKEFQFKEDIRLIGLSVSNITENYEEQISFLK
ncbi:MAG: DNA polymerase IV [Peptostreptococcales bacterium]